MASPDTADTPPTQRKADASSRRMWLVVAIAGVVALTGGTLRAACVGRSCVVAEDPSAEAPFCGLDESTRQAVAAGFRDGRSPDIAAVTSVPLTGSTADDAGRWPSLDAQTKYPVAFSGTGFAQGLVIDGIGFDQIAPTVAEGIGIDRPFPEVRSGKAIEGLAVPGERPQLVLEVMLVDGGPDIFESPPPALGQLLESASRTDSADPGSLPHDPVALTTTIGTGGLPRQHGVTGALLRNDSGELVEAWSRGAPPLVISALADDLDEGSGQQARIGYVATSRSHLGLVSGNWYIDNDKDEHRVVAAERIAGATVKLLRSGYGNDEIADLIAVSIPGDADDIQRTLAPIMEAANVASDGRLASVIVGLGGSEGQTASAVPASQIVDGIERGVGAAVIEGTVPGGFFVDQDVLAAEAITEDRVIRAVAGLRANGSKVFADVFSGIAISFERYC